MPEASLADWNEFLARHPDAHLLQTGEWGELKAAFGWEARRLIDGGAGAQVLFRRLPLGYSAAYIPKGPLFGDQDSAALGRFWTDLDELCRSRGAIFCKLEPDAWETDPPIPLSPGWVRSPHNIQPPRTLVVGLRGTEDEILGRMKQKTRYNIRLAAKKGIAVRSWADLESFHRMLTVTGRRDGFGVHTQDYYRRAHELFHPAGKCELLVAEFEGRPLAALMAFARGKRAWYVYGASNEEARNRMPTYLLQWEAMRWARGRGCETYDLWGAPDEEEAVLEAGFEARGDGLWGVYRFKRGFGGELKRAAQALDRIRYPWLYRLYLWRLAGRERA